MIIMSFGDRLVILRKSNGLTRKALAEKFSISYSALSNYENNERFPDQEMLIKIADFFDVSVDYLLGRTNIKKAMPSIEDSSFLPVMEKLEDCDITNKNFININDIKNLSPQNQARIADYIEILKLLEDKNLDSKK